MKKLITLLILLTMTSALSYEDRIPHYSLEQFCNDDPTGEIFSELTDAYDTQTQVDIVDLDWAEYEEIAENRNYDIYDLADRFSEVDRAVEYWEDKTCQTRGRDMFERYRR